VTEENIGKKICLDRFRPLSKTYRRFWRVFRQTDSRIPKEWKRCCPERYL